VHREGAVERDRREGVAPQRLEPPLPALHRGQRDEAERVIQQVREDVREQDQARREPEVAHESRTAGRCRQLRGGPRNGAPHPPTALLHKPASLANSEAGADPASKTGVILSSYISWISTTRLWHRTLQSTSFTIAVSV
jgi:hypothetical protein